VASTEDMQTLLESGRDRRRLRLIDPWEINVWSVTELVYLRMVWREGVEENTELSGCIDQTDHRRSGCLDGPEWSVQKKMRSVRQTQPIIAGC